jgi:hypothetical protein
MPQAHGFDNTVVIGKETTFATPATAFKWAGIVSEFTPEENNNVDSRFSVGTRAPLMVRQGQKEVDGAITVGLQNARLILAALGKSTTSGTASPYTHTISTVGKGEELPSLTVQNHNSQLNFTRNYVGGKVDTLTITAAAEEAVEMEAELLFSHVLDGTDGAITPAVVAAELENYFMFYEGSVKVNTASVADVTEFELEVNNNLERRFTLNGKNRPERIEEGNLEVSASLTMDFTSTNAWNQFKNGDTITVELTLQDSKVPNHSIKITLSGGLYDSNSLEVSAEDLQEQELEAIFTGISVVAIDSNSTLL